MQCRWKWCCISNKHEGNAGTPNITICVIQGKIKVKEKHVANTRSSSGIHTLGFLIFPSSFSTFAHISGVLGFPSSCWNVSIAHCQIPKAGIRFLVRFKPVSVLPTHSLNEQFLNKYSHVTHFLCGWMCFISFYINLLSKMNIITSSHSAA